MEGIPAPHDQAGADSSLWKSGFDFLFFFFNITEHPEKGQGNSQLVPQAFSLEFRNLEMPIL